MKVGVFLFSNHLIFDFLILGTFVIFPLCGEGDGVGGVPRAPPRRWIHAALLQDAAEQAHRPRRHHQRRCRASSIPHLDAVRTFCFCFCLP